MMLAYITCPSQDEAEKIAGQLIEAKLIACANLFPMESIYRWEGDIQNEQEYVLIAKTSGEKFGELKKRVKKIHPYDVPAILKIPVEGEKEYVDWLQGELG
ncbi:MAG: divalent cation tolerance protein CutA [Candidatus Altiarchaeales archaeon]|nr:divalent cation tolerance protein CutA [Candidatus Altiarchaeales archaeon]